MQVFLPPTIERAETEFHAMKARWLANLREDRSDRYGHHAYQCIVGLGPIIVPALIRELATDPEHDHWIWALEAVTRTRPGTSGYQPTVGYWLAWGRERKYID